MIPRILITPGEPAGIGPDICIMLTQQTWQAEIIFIADPDLLVSRAQQLGIPFHFDLIDESDIIEDKPLSFGIKILPVKVAAPVMTGELSIANVDYVLQTLALAARLCLQNQADAIVTGPVNKSIINQSRIQFSGHTEFFADYSGVSKTVMIFVTEQMRMALATTHIPLQAVAGAITRESLRETLTILKTALENQFCIKNPRIAICGLNPHAGENGYLGREEIDVIEPLMIELQAEGFNLMGPLPADTAFTPAIIQQCDAILAMYHDQGLPVVKYASFGHAVNMTLGLPFIRTSVDHGTALAIAGTHQADPGSLRAALSLAIDLATRNPI